MELGVTEAVQKHVHRHVIERHPVTQRRLAFEHSRPRLLREMAAEATGVFIYVYPGIASTASFTLNHMEAQFSSIFQIGWAYALGIAFAIITSAATSGGHFSPGITLSLAIFRGFPWKKVPFYIAAQIFGAFLAGVLLMGQYHEQISLYAATTTKAGLGTVFNGGPASILVTLPMPTQTNQGSLVLIEFFVDTFLGLVIWSVLDPGNPFIHPAGAPFVVGLAYAAMIWGFAPATISTNMARDLGCRLAAAVFYGWDVFSYMNYSWISIIINIPATLVAVSYYEVVMRDSLDRIAKGVTRHESGDEGLYRHLSKTGKLDRLATELSLGV
ncbi:aquaporin-like protein [Eremomyces bilateralis CBS 781.70]|uniref:Aquaporin-like protein n=1 Tax=Eremomyces bilateralis CBS 781.70 TaxID=1392243 RepID=A0A6G1GEB2_9PEZI|nr:aquaporin-like protein [Eremomyces bilateralis CBS 781.70]KAF1816210.1 aquaporin-like protein [Eremomyces bilateralis CBS 781.70]